MKRVMTLLVFVGAILLLAQDSVFARGGGGGGRGGGGGGASAGGGGGMSAAAGRSPSMGAGAAARPAAGAGAAARPAAGGGAAARPAAGAGAAARPAAGAGTAAGGARPATGAGAAGARPSAGQLNNFLDVPRASTGAGAGAAARPGAGGAAADFLQGGGGATASQLPARAGAGAAAAARPGVGAGVAAGVGAGAAAAARPGVGAGATGARAENMSNNRAGRVENRQELQGNRQQRRDEVRNQVAANHPRLDFWSDHPGWAARRITRPYRWATWAALGGWIGYGATEPATYAYGESVYYEGDQVYYGDQAVATADQYAQQAETIAASAAQAQPENSEWLPLGVFAITQDGQPSGVEPTLFMQLAISKEGVISGTFKNTATDQVQTLEGMADKKSQRVRLGHRGSEVARHGDGNIQSHAGFLPGADPLCRWPDTAVAYGAASRAETGVNVALSGAGPCWERADGISLDRGPRITPLSRKRSVDLLKVTTISCGRRSGNYKQLWSQRSFSD